MGQYQTKQLLYNKEKNEQIEKPTYKTVKQAKILTNPTSDKRLISKKY